MALGINGIRVGCEFPTWMHYALIFYMISFILLFGNFYAKQYLAKGRENWNAFRKNSKSIDDNNNKRTEVSKKIK